MGWLRWLGISAMIVGACLLAYAFYLGEVVVALVLIFPVIISTGAVGAAAMLLLFLGFMALVLSFFSLGEGEVDSMDMMGPENGDTGHSSGFGGVVLIGPIPIIFGSGRRTALIAAGLGMLVMAMVILFLSLR